MTAEDIDNYKKMVDSTSDRLLDLCNRWTREITENKDIDEEIVQRIQSVIGKSQLLRTSKFKQFRGFLNDAEQNTIGKPVKVDDIRGFWETIYIQVKEVENTFDRLDKLKQNDYVESNIADTVPDGVCSKKSVKKTTSCKKPIVSASSSLKNFISAQRERKKLNNFADEIQIAGTVSTNGHA